VKHNRFSALPLAHSQRTTPQSLLAATYRKNRIRQNQDKLAPCGIDCSTFDKGVNAVFD
jgi:hypothetical protein